jgi:hypothetical protein
LLLFSLGLPFADVDVPAFGCNRSDADADVLADYVLALLRHDGDVKDVRKLCEEEIPDFLKEGALSPLLTTSAVCFVDVFDLTGA